MKDRSSQNGSTLWAIYIVNVWRATDDSCERLMELTVNDNNYNHHGRQKGGLLRTRRIAVVLGVSLLVILHFTRSIAKIPGSISSKEEQLDFDNNTPGANDQFQFPMEFPEEFTIPMQYDRLIHPPYRFTTIERQTRLPIYKELDYTPNLLSSLPYDICFQVL